MPHKTSSQEYISAINSMEADAVQNNEKFTSESAELLRRYKGEPYGNELPERSKVVSNDVLDLVEADMPALARVFLGANKPCTFKPSSDNPQDIEEAKQKTEYIDWLVRGQTDSFSTQLGFLKDVVSQKFGALKWFMEDVVEKKEYKLEDHSAEEIAAKMEELDGDDVESVEIVSRGEVNISPNDVTATERVNATIEVTVKTRKARVVGVPIESLLFSTGAKNEDDANLVGDRENKTRGELIKEGYPMDKVAKLTSSGKEDATLPQVRFDGNSDELSGEDYQIWANQEVEIRDLYVMVDKDGDGVSQRRHILKSGDVILEDEPFEMVPYAITSAIIMSHSMIGLARAELVTGTALIQTALKRGLLDNTYSHAAPQVGVNENVNQDDLLTKRPGGIVRVKGTENPGQSVFPMNVDYIGNEQLQVIQSFDQERARTTGDYMASAGLNSDTFADGTATSFKGITERGAEKIELVARVISETAYKRLYSGLAWYVSQYQTTDQEIMVLGQQLTVNPSSWQFKQEVFGCVGLGAGDGEKQVEVLTGIFQLQSQLKAEGSPLVDEVGRYNTIDAILKASDIHDTSQYFNNPERPDQLLVAENEQLKAVLEQMQVALEQLQAKNPLAEAEQVKAQAALQAKVIDLQSKREIDAAKLEESIRQFNVQTAQKSNENQARTALELTKIEANTNKNVPGSLI